MTTPRVDIPRTTSRLRQSSESCRGNRTYQQNFTTPQHLTTRPNSKHTSTGCSDIVSLSTLYRASGSPKGEAVGGPRSYTKRSSNTNTAAMLSTKTVLRSKWHELCAGTHLNNLLQDASTSSNKEGSKALALWPSGKARALCTEC